MYTLYLESDHLSPPVELLPCFLATIMSLNYYSSLTIGLSDLIPHTFCQHSGQQTRRELTLRHKGGSRET